MTANQNQSSTPSKASARGQAIRSWPLVLLAAPAAVAVWSGWVGIGRMTGFGQVHPLPGIWDSLHLDSAITLPIGVEAYGAFALRAWLSASPTVMPAARRFARWSAIASLLLGMAGQIAYHLLTETGTVRAPWAITTAVSCLPVLVLGMGAALAHLLRAELAGTSTHTSGTSPTTPHPASGQLQEYGSGHQHRGLEPCDDVRLAQARAAANRLVASGQPLSRRRLRAAGVKGSNAHLGELTRTLTAELGARPPSSSQP